MSKKNQSSIAAAQSASLPPTAKSRRGSALLIVLGMLAFMIVSAVAFSAYMRFSRMPSSYLRRTSASRLLVKAALARAIDEIDAAIGNNPHPGVGVTQTRYPRNTDESRGVVGTEQQRNIWLHRVFFGDGDAVSTEDTVSPLTLEGLAYIPPPLVNDARYLSRLSPAAAWKSLGFDAGRYAFCAIDVSDYFDVNRIMANTPRSSAANRRVSLSYLFENDDHTSYGSDASAWDNWMKEFRTINDDSNIEWSGNIAPLVSVADFNLALGYKNGIGKMTSPFYKFIENGKNTFYDARGDADYDRINRMTFVTDGLFLEDDDSAYANKTYDLADPKNQPFDINPSANRSASISDILTGQACRPSSRDEMKWHERLGGVGLAALYDYLDPDHVPVSLAVPTTERTPMICGIQLNLDGARLQTKKEFEPADAPKVVGGPNNQGERTVEQTVIYRLDPDALNLTGGRIDAVYAYPFNKNLDISDNFKLDGRVSLFFSTQQMSLRTRNSEAAREVLHLNANERNKISSGVDQTSGLINIALEGNGNLSINKEPKEEKDAVKDITIPFDASKTANDLSGNDGFLLSVKYTWRQRNVPNPIDGGASDTWEPDFEGMLADQSWVVGKPVYDSKLCIVDSRGRRNTSIENLVKNSTTLYLNAAVWLRIKNKDGKTVDLVPACLGDDNIQNPSGGDNIFDGVDGGDFGYYFPLMRFDTAGQGSSASLVLSVDPNAAEGLETLVTQGKQLDVWPKAAIVADPRFNYAPENWYAVQSGLSDQAWLTAAQGVAGNRDGDIFMDVSDNGYLQSKYELAMLPACANLRSAGSPKDNGAMKSPNQYRGNSIPASQGEAIQGDWMWSTYDPIGDDSAAFSEMKWVAGKGGFRINPYSDSTNVIMAAFANTPLNWACAGTNDVDDAINFNFSDPSNPKGADFNRDYAWNEYSSGAKFAWNELEAVAGAYIEKIHQLNGNWEAAWDQLDWYGDNFCGVTLTDTDELWNVDRKFFYGFWKDCFAARQQLFLVFVRAEPVMMGGGGTGQIPPQLGARAVALVWRNPSNTKRDGNALEENTPHQTRVLFYRQLD